MYNDLGFRLSGQINYLVKMFFNTDFDQNSLFILKLKMLNYYTCPETSTEIFLKVCFKT